MRPQQQNRRMRGRGGNNNNNNNNNRRGPNPLTRNYESNGPDVKIRGSAQQIAEKYATLARDAQSAGDRVMAENYLQHAEHYNRIIAAAQAQQAAQQQQNFRDDQDDDLDEDRDEGGNETQQPQRPSNDRAGSDGSGPQPVIEGTPAEVALEQEQMRSNDNEPRRERANGAHAAAPNGVAADEEGQPRRGRRPRRGRGRDRDGETGEAGETQGEAPALVPAQD